MAISTIKLSAKSEKDFYTEVNGSHKFIVDQPKPTGSDAGCNPLEYFLSTLPACIIALGRIIAKQDKLEVGKIEVEVEGDIDKKVLMGNSEDNRVGFLEIRAKVNIESEMTTAEKKAYLAKIAKRCPIADVMINGTKVINTLI